MTGTLAASVPRSALIGEGTCGVVWRARDRRTKVWYAVKNMKPPSQGGDPQIVSQECQVAMQIVESPHPSIVHHVSVHHFQDTNTWSIIMELCHGGSLLDKIADARKSIRTGTYEHPPEAKGWIGQMFLGIEFLHNRNLLFRDCKPENIVISRKNVAKITDFGFGRVGTESEGLWSFGIPTGTPGYCAPEILSQEPYNCSSDMYSFGVLVWVLLTGGVTNRPLPAPPFTRGWDRLGYSVLQDDWQKLMRCITDPEDNFARPLPHDSTDFVLGLTKRVPEQRLGNEDVRAHAFMQPMRLPPQKASYTDVAMWAISVDKAIQSCTTDDLGQADTGN